MGRAGLSGERGRAVRAATRAAGVVLALLVAIALAACGGGSGGTEGASGGTQATGSGYAVSLPPGWSDGTAQAKSGVSPINFDRVFLGPRTEAFTANVNVVRESAPASTGLSQVVAAGRRQLQGGFGATNISTPAERTLDGERALSYTYDVSRRGKALRGQQVVALHGGVIYYATLTSAASAFDANHRPYEEILGSWRWR